MPRSRHGAGYNGEHCVQAASDFQTRDDSATVGYNRVVLAAGPTRYQNLSLRVRVFFFSSWME